MNHLLIKLLISLVLFFFYFHLYSYDMKMIIPLILLCFLAFFNIYNFVFKLDMYLGGGVILKYENKDHTLFRIITLLVFIGLLGAHYYFIVGNN